MANALSKILLYSCIAAFVTGIVIAAASLISYMAAISGAWLRRKVHQPWDGGPHFLTMYFATLD